MIRVGLTYLDHTVDLRTDADYNPEVMETLIREAQEALATQILTVEAMLDLTNPRISVSI